MKYLEASVLLLRHNICFPQISMSSHKRELMSKISSYKTSYEAPARVLLLGPVGSGKSSFISSVQSVFSGRVLNRAMVGSSTTGFTKKVGQNRNTAKLL